MKYLNKLFLIISIIFFQDHFSNAQGVTGGHSTFQFLNVSCSPRNTALGSDAIAWTSQDPSSSYYNPALIHPNISNNLSFNQLYYFDGIHLGSFSYTYKPIKFGLLLQAGVQYLKATGIPTADEFGTVNGDTKVNESDFYLAGSKKLNERITLGSSVHFLSSSLAQYSSKAFSLNAGINYIIPDKSIELAFIIRNVGTSFTNYQFKKERLPLTSELGFAKKMKHIPFIFHVTAHHLEYWNVRYDDPVINAEADLFGNIKTKSGFSKFSSNLFRHLTFGGEMLIGKSESFALRIGYNHLRRMEVNINDYSLFGGLSFGFGLKIYMFKFDFSHANYHLAGGTNTIGITTNLSSFIKKNNI